MRIYPIAVLSSFVGLVVLSGAIASANAKVGFDRAHIKGTISGSVGPSNPCAASVAASIPPNPCPTPPPPQTVSSGWSTVSSSSSSSSGSSSSSASSGGALSQTDNATLATSNFDH